MCLGVMGMELGWECSPGEIPGHGSWGSLGDPVQGSGAPWVPLHLPSTPQCSPASPSHSPFPRKGFAAGSNYRVNNGPSLAVNVFGSFITNRREMTQKDITHGVAGNYFYGSVRGLWWWLGASQGPILGN